MSFKHTNEGDCPSCAEKLSEACQGLQDWFKALKPRYPNAHISWAFRDEASQEQAFTSGATKLHFPLSAHNKTPALALDLFQLSGDKAIWNPSFFFGLDQEILNEKLPIKWGGRWKGLGDNDHFEWGGE